MRECCDRRHRSEIELEEDVALRGYGDERSKAMQSCCRVRRCRADLQRDTSDETSTVGFEDFVQGAKGDLMQG